MNVGKLFVGAALLLMPSGMNACRYIRPSVCEAVNDADVVVRASLVSSVDVEGTSFHADTILKAVEVFKMEAGLEKYAVGEEFHVFTPGSSNSCGPLWTNFGEEMLLDFNRIEGWSTYLEDGGLYVNVASQRIWSDLSEDDEEALRSCTCNGGCGTFQECVPNSQGYLQDGVAVEAYCEDVCDPSPCSDGEVCELLVPTCLAGAVCTSHAYCAPASAEPTPAPTTPGGIISCESYECSAGYTNVDRDCSMVPSPPGSLRGRNLQNYADDDFYSTDGYTTLGNFPICRHDKCCEVDPTPAGPVSLGCFKDDGSDRIMDDRALVDNSMTTELCELTCAGSPFFSTQYGRECWCGSADTDYAKHGESTGCTYECPGNPGDTCGGFYAANVYAYSTTTSYLGCFQDDRDRIMELALTDRSSMTKEICEAECTGSAYFGLQYGQECWCGDQDTDLLKHGESTACSYECPGDSGQTCGGGWAMSVYKIN